MACCKAVVTFHLNAQETALALVRTGEAGTCGPRSRWDNRRPVTGRPSDLRRQVGAAGHCSARPLIVDANAFARFVTASLKHRRLRVRNNYAAHLVF